MGNMSPSSSLSITSSTDRTVNSAVTVQGSVRSLLLPGISLQNLDLLHSVVTSLIRSDLAAPLEFFYRGVDSLVVDNG
jgi:hypothetical protein